MLLQTRNFTAPSCFTPTTKTNTKISTYPSNSISFRNTKCSVTVSTENKIKKPFPAEVSRTIMDLARVGTLSTLTQQGYPLGVGVRFVVDSEDGNPFFYFNHNAIPTTNDNIHTPSSLHVKVFKFYVF